MENTLDVVYVLGTGSTWSDNEIRFSLRSIEKNLSGIGKVFIVGELPEFLQDVIHIPAEDIFEPGINADGNIITKVIAACKDERLSKKFLFINDDHMVMEPMLVSNIPPFHKGNMKTFDKLYWDFNFWRKRLKRTMEILMTKNRSTLHFDCHTPIIFHKMKFIDIVNQFDYSADIGYTMKSIYGNFEYPDAPLLGKEKKIIAKHFKLRDLREILAIPQFVSFNDQGLNGALKWWLIENFPSKSRFEKNHPQDKIFDLFFWNKLGRNYNLGVIIFKKHYKHKNLIRMLETGHTDILQKKLFFKLNADINKL